MALLFLGRVERLKGGHVLIEALPVVAARLGPIHLTIAGDGPERPSWEAQAARTAANHSGIIIEFVGWLSGASKEARFANTDLLVVPSIWPEPYGLVGLEAARYGVPSAAFNVGGIGDWLSDGETGRLAPSSPPTARGLAEAIIQCLSDPTHFDYLSTRARSRAADVSWADHITSIQRVFERVSDEGPHDR